MAGKSVQLTMTRAEWDVLREALDQRATGIFWGNSGEVFQGLREKVKRIEAARVARDGA